MLRILIRSWTVFTLVAAGFGCTPSPEKMESIVVAYAPFESIGLLSIVRAAAATFSVDSVCASIDLPPKGVAEHKQATVRVLLVDDHALFRNGMARLLKNETGFEVVGQAADGKEAIELAQKLKPNTILMDISMPGINGIEATRVIHHQFPEIRIIGLSMHEDQEQARAMIDAGAADYKSKGCATSELIATIRGTQQVRAS